MTGKKVIVVGGGIGGLAVAAGVGQLDYEVTVIERAPALAEVGAGLTLWPNGIKALRALGIEGVRHTGQILTAGGIREPSGRWLIRTDPSDFTREFGEPMVALHRADLQAALFDVASGVAEIRLGVSVAGFDRHDSTVAVELGDGSRLDGDLLIGADGVDSIVRRRLFGVEKRYTGFLAWRGVVDFTSDDGGGSEAVGRGRIFGFLPIGDRRTYWYAAMRLPESEAVGPHQDKLFERFGNWHEPIPELILKTSESDILCNPMHEVPRLREWTAGNVSLVGDAAHAMFPNLGQGACQGLEDAVVLRNALSARSDPGRALSEYEKTRLRRANRVAARSRTMGRVVLASSRTAVTMRNRAMSLTPDSILKLGLKPILNWDPTKHEDSPRGAG